LDKILPNRFTVLAAEWFAGDETPSREHMADIVHARDDLAASGPTPKKSIAKKPDAAFSLTERSNQPPRTDPRDAMVPGAAAH